MQPASSKRASVLVNGKPTVTDALTLAELLSELGYGEGHFATALNGAFVPRAERTQARLAAQDRIEIVAPRQGG